MWVLFTLLISIGSIITWANNSSYSDLDRLGIWGSFVGGVASLIALLFVYKEYIKSLKKEASKERYELAINVLPSLFKSWALLHEKGYEYALLIEITKYHHHINDDSKRTFIETLHSEMKSKKYQLVTNLSLFKEQAEAFQVIFNKIRFSSSYYHDKLEIDFSNFKKHYRKVDALVYYINKLEGEELSFSFALKGGTNKLGKSLVESLIADINTKEFENLNTDNYKSYISKKLKDVEKFQFSFRSKFIEPLIKKAQLRTLNLE